MDAVTATWRATQKAHRRASLMRSAARLFAERGFAAVSTVELGEAVGMSGPALYNYFPSKDALLAELLTDASARLLDGCREIVAEQTAPADTLARLVRFHLDFATADPDTIRLQDRELAQLAPDANHEVRRLQREYVQEWDAVLARLRPHLGDDERQTRLLAAFGLLNSTPHSAVAANASEILAAMALRALAGTD
ncbi:TetR/AcrR family transcriptional regulator [Microbacterium sp. S16(2024)]|jgi:AcrR family transcriptional regulator|uniref:TetR/AcrR family transcriptional regulator n=1 Tax=Microbacterium sp. S16(2024) TaxID=3368601 RepID=UPI0010FD228A|nr:TetR/AcrR family transcriptional regulator [Microbacterium sp. 5K110]